MTARRWRILHSKPEKLQFALFAVGLLAVLVFSGALFAEHWPTVWISASVAGVSAAIGAVRDWRGFRLAWARIGADGVLYRGHGKPRFVPYARVRKLTAQRLRYGAFARLELDDGSVIRLRGRDAEFGETLRDAFEEFGRGVAVEPHPSLARQADSPKEWERRVRSTSAHTEYRAAPPSSELLVRIAEDPHAASEQRIGAVLALSATNDEERKTRVRVAVEATAEPELQSAMEEALGGKVDLQRFERLTDR